MGAFRRFWAGLAALPVASQRRLQGYRWLSQQPAMLVWAMVAGVLGALATMAFYEGIHLFQRTFFGQQGAVEDVIHALPWWARLLAPVFGGLVAGILLVWAGRYGNNKPSDYMESVAIGDGQLSVREGLLRSVSSLFSVASGGSIGREGAMVHLGAMGASILGRFFSFNRSRLRLIVACGAAAGVAAAYGAPIAGALFVAEIVLGTMAIQTVGPLLIAAGVSSLTVSTLADHQVSYMVPDLPMVDAVTVLPLLLLGVLSGVAAPYFLKGLDFSRSLFKRTGLALPLRLALGGALLGMLLVFLPSVSGNGYSVVSSLLNTAWPWYAVLLIIVFKLLATAFTVGSGAVGGVFTPTIFVGAAFGTLFGQVLAWVAPSLALSPYLYTAVGMGAFLSAGTGAPLMAVLMIFEMTHSFTLVLPLMLASVLAYFVARAIAEVAIYEVTLTRERDVLLRNRLRNTLLGDLVKPAVTVVSTPTPVSVALQMFNDYPVRYVYVVDEDSVFQGVIAQQDLTSLLRNQGDISETTAGDVLRLDFVKPVHPDMSLDEAQEIFVNFSGERLPVVTRGDQPKLLGVVYKSSVLETYFAMKRSLDSGGDSIYF